MCGISGIFNYSNKYFNGQPIIKKINDIQSDRGPDDNGIFESKNKKIILGHTRLSIIDLSKDAKQPFISKDEDYILTFNGEIYNYKELKNELIKMNVSFKSNSDTEVLVESYKMWGTKCLDKLRGMFAFALWDKKKNIMFLARDPFGIKPLYYSNIGGIFYFASQIKSLLSIKEISKTKNNESVFNYYLWGNISEPSTIYKDIMSLEKGSYKIININGSIQNFNYANIKETILKSENFTFKDKLDSQEYLKEIIDDTVKAHQISDVPVQILLSAGIDSNAILASTDNTFKKNVTSLTIDFGYDNNDETYLASLSSKNNNIKHNIEKISENESKDLLKNFFKKMDSPTNDGFNSFSASYVAKKNKNKVLLTGVGGDELFSGYPSFNRIPKIIKIMNILPSNIKSKNFYSRKFEKFLKNNKLNTKIAGLFKYGKSVDKAFLLQRSLFLPEEIQEILLSKQNQLNINQLNIFNTIEDDVKGFENLRVSILYLEIKYYLCAKLLKDIDWTSMSNSIEMRTPLVDWTFFKKIIPLIKSNIEVDKKDLFNCYSKKLPAEISNRKKTGFSIPHKKLLNQYTNSNYHLKYSKPIKDWSIFCFKNYLSYEKN